MNISAPLAPQIPGLYRLWQDAFHDSPEFLHAFHTTAFHPDRCRCVTLNGQVVAALYWFDCLYMSKPVAYLYAIATAQSFRRQGICHHLLKDTHRHLAKLNYQGTILVPGNKSLFQLYESMGYHTCSQIHEFCCPRGRASVPLSCITGTEYATMRKMLLPEGGVIQEKENLHFLQTQAHFYAGPGFVLAARPEKNILYGIELLGNKAVAPGIVRSFDCSSGTFRTPGCGTPFAMYHPLTTDSLPPPSYFGLAFDW